MEDGTVVQRSEVITEGKGEVKGNHFLVEVWVLADCGT